MATDDELVRIGIVGRAHGLDGAFVVDGASDDPGRWEIGATLLADGARATVRASRRVGGGKLAIRLDREVPRGAELTIPRSELPEPEEGEFFVFELVGLAVECEGSPVGVVADVLSGVANDNLQLEDGRLIPLIEDAILAVDRAAGRISVAPGYVGG